MYPLLDEITDMSNLDPLDPPSDSQRAYAYRIWLFSPRGTLPEPEGSAADFEKYIAAHAESRERDADAAAGFLRYGATQEEWAEALCDHMIMRLGVPHLLDDLYGEMNGGAVEDELRRFVTQCVFYSTSLDIPKVAALTKSTESYVTTSAVLAIEGYPVSLYELWECIVFTRGHIALSNPDFIDDLKRYGRGEIEPTLPVCPPEWLPSRDDAR